MVCMCVLYVCNYVCVYACVRFLHAHICKYIQAIDPNLITHLSECSLFYCRETVCLGLLVKSLGLI